MTPYLEYKATNLPWLPQIPAHWEIVRAKQIFSPIDIRSEKGEEQLLSVSERYGVVKREHANVTMFQAASYEGYRLCWPDDLAINSLWAWSYGLGFSPYHGIISTAYSVFRLKDKTQCLPRFYDYFVRGKNFHWELRVRSKGLWKSRYQLSDDAFLAAPMLFAPINEQEQIVRYLDSMTVKINKLIRAKKKICDLIFEEILLLANEHINNAKLPRYRLKNVIKLVGDQIIRKDETLYTPIGVLNRGRGIFHKQQLLGKDLGDSEFFNVSPGDMIFSGQFAWEGAVAILQETERGCIASHRYPLARAINRELLKLEYLWAFFQTKYGDMLLNIHSHGAAGRNRPLNIMRLLSEAIPIPPLEEQKKIEKLFLQLKEAKELAAKYSAQLQEYKNSLIASVVTGQVDVRNIQVEDFDPADLISETDDDPAEDDDQPQEESEVE